MKKEEKAFLAIVTERVEHVTLSLTLDTRKREVRLPVAVRVNANRQTMYHRTGLRCTLDEWQDIYKSAKRGINFETKKSQLVTYSKVKAAVTDLLNNNSFTFDQLKSRLTGKQATNFSEYWLKLADAKKTGTRQCYIDAYNSFTDIVGLNADFTSISIPLIKRWEAGMTKKGHSVTTIGMYYRAARAVINAAMSEGHINPSQYPFGKGKVVIRKGRSRTDEYLSVQEIKRLMAFKAPEGYWFPGYEKVVYEALNLWMFSYLGNGLNMADMAVLKLSLIHI